MKAPTATYRIQLNHTFPFSSLRAIVPYLSKLGISHIYASPIFQAQPGSLHGYNITDPTTINPELGTKADLKDLLHELNTYGLGWLQDIVPNHAACSPQNKQLYDVLTNGFNSTCASFFDIDWNYPSKTLSGKLLLPLLTEHPTQCIKKGQIRLAHSASFQIVYNNLTFPLNNTTQQQLNKEGSIQQVLDKYNNNPQLFNTLLTKQYYRLAHWQTAYRYINYRRFFDINGLIGTCMETSSAFAKWHQLIFELMQLDTINALRVDHIDGLYDPQTYLKELRANCPDAYLVVEKILTGEEQLPKTWPIEGTTGYDFLNYVNKLLIQSANESAFSALYQNFTANTQTFDNLLYQAKKAVVMTYFLGDAQNLARLFANALSESMVFDTLLDQPILMMVVELLACFPIYRTYLDGSNCDDDSAFRTAIELAQTQNPKLTPQLTALTNLLNKHPTSPTVLFALRRFQQFTGAVMAKGFEDTLFYRYTRLISLNEVGSSPAQFGISLNQFHEFNQLRHQNWPLTLNATSTHDTKRGEDTRARLNVLSQIPQEFQTNLTQWQNLVFSKKKQINGATVPDNTETYYLYQTLLGAYPWNDIDQKEFPNRIAQHMIKALREAKVHSCWIKPNLPYEETVAAFVLSILSDAKFMDAFWPLQRKVAVYGLLNSLTQTLLKMTCPGIPDFYWGTELWDLTLVDPDNRRPIDFMLRQNLLSKVATLNPKKIRTLLATPNDGKAKLYTIYKTLQFRKRYPLLFEKGKYLPITLKGTKSNHALAFCRTNNNRDYVLIITPRFAAGLFSLELSKSQTSNPQIWHDNSWADTCLCLPKTLPSRWTNIFTEKKLSSNCEQLLPLHMILNDFPIALLYGDKHD